MLHSACDKPGSAHSLPRLVVRLAIHGGQLVCMARVTFAAAIAALTPATHHGRRDVWSTEPHDGSKLVQGQAAILIAIRSREHGTKGVLGSTIHFVPLVHGNGHEAFSLDEAKALTLCGQAEQSLHVHLELE